MELTTSYQKLGEKKLGNSYGDLYIRIYAKYSEQDVANNQTKVQYQARGYYSGNSYILDQQSSGNVKGTSASQVNFSRSSSYSSGETTLGTTEAWVKHNSDGTMSISASAYLSFPNWGWSGTASGTATLPNLHKPPVINTATMVETNSVLTAISVPNTTVVQYLSKKTITLSATAYDSATLKYRLRHFNTNYDIPSSSTFQTSATFNTDYTTHDVAIGSGKASIIQDVGDSLNGLSTDWVYVNIGGTAQKPNGIAYTKPALERATTNIKRKSGNGTNLTDNKAVLNIKAKIYKTTADVVGNNNSVTQLGYKIWATDASEPSSYTSVTSSVDSSGNVTISPVTINNIIFTKVYNYKIIIKDKYNYTDTILDGKVPTGESTWTEYKDRVDFVAATIGGSPIVESGSNGNGNYIKYYDGTMICYKSVTASVAMTTAWGNLYEGKMVLGNWPTNFISSPNVQITNASGAGAMIESYDTAPTTSSAGAIYLARANSRTSDVTINVLAIGKWK